MSDPKHILIIEDSPEVCELMQEMLGGAGYSTEVAPDGQSGLEAARKRSPNLIIMDVMLPNLSGLKVCRLLKFDKKFKGVPVVILTAKFEKDEEKLSKEVGADAYLNKPLDTDQLLSTIRRLTENVG